MSNDFSDNNETEQEDGGGVSAALVDLEDDAADETIHGDDAEALDLDNLSFEEEMDGSFALYTSDDPEDADLSLQF